MFSSKYFGRMLACCIVAILCTVAVGNAQDTYNWPDVRDVSPTEAIKSTSHPDYPGFPSPLRFFDFENNSVNGVAVTSADQWDNARRPEIADMVQNYMYGYLPPAPTNLTGTVLSEDADYFGDGSTTRRVVELKYGPSGTKPATMNLYIPNHVAGPAPVVVSLNKEGNDKIEPGGSRAHRWHLENTLARGYALATVHTSDFASDGGSYQDAVITPYANDGYDGNWKAMGAWSYGISRMVDYLDTDSDINADWTVVTGFSRRGKAALFAAAMDERIEMVAPHQSGAGGAHPTRTDWGGGTAYSHRFTHWFLDEFNALRHDGSTFIDDTDFLPFDQDSVLALVAPRLVYLSEGQAYGANEAGVQALIDSAAPVWELLGYDSAESLYLAWDSAASDNNHTFDLDHWNGILDFADAQLVPEPTTMALLGMGGLLALRRRRRRRA